MLSKKKSSLVTNKLKVNRFFNDLRFKSELLKITLPCTRLAGHLESLL